VPTSHYETADGLFESISRTQEEYNAFLLIMAFASAFYFFHNSQSSFKTAQSTVA